MVVQDGVVSKEDIYMGADAIKEFADRIENECHNIASNILLKSKPMLPLTEEQIEDFNNAEKCRVCDS